MSMLPGSMMNTWRKAKNEDQNDENRGARSIVQQCADRCGDQLGAERNLPAPALFVLVGDGCVSR